MEIKVDVVSPADREKLVAQLMVGSEQIAELNQEQETLQLEVYGRKDGQPWLIEYSEFITALIEAKARLVG